MRITLLLVGKTTNKHLEALVEDYCGRIGHYLPFEVKIIPELKSTKSLTVEQQKEKEGELILQHIRQGDRLILLDERGKQYRSVDFAAFLTKQCSMSAKRIVFLIGGPCCCSSSNSTGHSPSKTASPTTTKDNSL